MYKISTLPHYQETYNNNNVTLPQTDLEKKITDVTQSVLKMEISNTQLETTEDLPLLYAFTSQGLSPENYELKAGQEELIKDLFNERTLDSKIFLLDLLGLEIYDRIDNILGRDAQEMKESLQREFGSLFFLIYLHFIKIASNTQNIDSKIAHDFFGGPENTPLLDSLKQIKTNIHQLVLVKKSQINQSSASEGIKKFLSKELNKKIEKFDQYFDLFLDLFQSPEATTLLFLCNLTNFSGSYSLENPEKSAFEDLKKYNNYIQSLFSSAEIKGYSAIPLSHAIKTLISFINSLDTLEITAIPQFQQHIAYICTLIHEKKLEIRTTIPEIQKGNLTHAKWIKENGLQLKTHKNQEEFLAMFYQMESVCALSEGLIADLKRIAENEILLKRFPYDFIPENLLEARIIKNIHILTTNSSSNQNGNISQNKNLSNLLKNNVQSIFMPLLNGIKKTEFFNGLNKSITQFLPQDLAISQIVNLQASTKKHEIALITNEFQLPIKNLNELNTQLPNILSQVLQEIEEYLFEKAKQGTFYQLEEIEELLFQEMIPFLPSWIFLKDIETLTTKTIVPLVSEELANFLKLEGLTLPKPIQEDTIVTDTLSFPYEKVADPYYLPTAFSTSHIDNLSEGAISSGDFPVDSSTNLLQEKKSNTAVIRSRNKDKSNRSSIKSSSNNLKLGEVKPPSEKFVSPSDKVRKILQILEQLGFIQVRTKGSHAIYKLADPNNPKKGTGKIVVLPIGHGDTLAKGTADSVNDMVTAALNTKNQSRNKKKNKKK
jgi:predicted RNA binding protein YcfA (HicA-like mRNA interferase family)